MVLPLGWHTQEELSAKGRLLPPRNLKVKLTEAFAQTIPQSWFDIATTTVVTWNPATKYVTCSDNPYTLYLLECDLLDAAYDQLNRLNVAWMSGGDVYLYWYDTLTAAFTTTNFGIAEMVVFIMDDVRHYSQSQSTLLLFYVRAGVVYYRAQADRFTIEYAVTTLVADSMLANVGLNENLRLQLSISQVSYTDIVDYLIQVDSTYVITDNSYLGEIFE